jgi:hypothetical protein
MKRRATKEIFVLSEAPPKKRGGQAGEATDPHVAGSGSKTKQSSRGGDTAVGSAHTSKIDGVPLAKRSSSRVAVVGVAEPEEPPAVDNRGFFVGSRVVIVNNPDVMHKGSHLLGERGVVVQTPGMAATTSLKAVAILVVLRLYQCYEQVCYSFP